MREAHSDEPRHRHGLPHAPFKAIVAPRPIGWASTVDAGGRPDLAPYSFFNAFCEAPPPAPSPHTSQVRRGPSPALRR